MTKTNKTQHTAPQAEEAPHHTQEAPTVTNNPDSSVQDTEEGEQQLSEPQGPAAEARKYRKRLQETKAALEAAEARVDTLQTAEVERLAAEAGIIKPAAIWLSGITLDGLRDENGNIDAQTAQQHILDAQTNLGLATRADPKPDPSQHPDARTIGDDKDLWSQSFKF